VKKSRAPGTSVASESFGRARKALAAIPAFFTDASLLFALIVLAVGRVAIGRYVFSIVKDIACLSLAGGLATWAVGGAARVRATFAFRGLVAAYDWVTATYERRPRTTVGAITGAYVALWTAIAVLQYVNWHIDVSDLSIFYQELWNTLHGHFYFTCLMPPGPLFSDYVDPINLLFLPFVAIFRSPLVLTVGQNIVVPASALFVWMLARQRTDSPGLQWVIPLLFLAFMPLHALLRYDYHSNAPAIPLLLGAFVCFEKRRFGWFWALAILALACKETIWIGLAGFGVGTALASKELRRQAIGLAVASIAVGVFELIVLPALEDVNSHVLDQYPDMGATWGQFFTTIATKPGVVWRNIFHPGLPDFLYEVLGPFWFLPLAFLPSALPLAAFVLVYSLSPGGCELCYTDHHAGEFIPYLVYGLICVLPRVERWALAKWNIERRTLQRGLAIALLATVLLQYGRPESYYLRRAWRPVHPDVPMVEAAIARYVPPEAGAAGETCMLAHVSNRRYAVDWQHFAENIAHIDVVVRHPGLCRPSWMNAPDDVDAYVRAHSFAPVFQNGQLTIYRRQR
jgi:hypothetical protein